MLTEHEGRPIRGPADFRREFPIRVTPVPVLGPIEHEEGIVLPETVQRNLATHRASRNFRNYWLRNQEEFSRFSQLISETWPGMDILPPEIMDGGSESPHVAMFCVEGRGRIQRELYWVGFGFQIWCQLLTHIIRADDASIIVIDEPEIYLHPQLQRMLLSVLRNLGPDVLLATHSTDLIQEADPSDILLVERSRQSAKRVGGQGAAQQALSLVGSTRNDVLTSAARTKRIAFVEGDEFKLLRLFAERAGLRDLARTSGITPVPLGGFIPPQQIIAKAQGISEALGDDVQFAVILDRDFRPPGEIREVKEILSKEIDLVHIHERKEIENYLFVPGALSRAIDLAITDRSRRRGTSKTATVQPVEDILSEVTRSIKSVVEAQYIAGAVNYNRAIRSTKDISTIGADTIDWFEETWGALGSRLSIVPGKSVLSLLNAHLQREYKVAVTPRMILAEMRRVELPTDVLELLRRLDRMRS